VDKATHRTECSKFWDKAILKVSLKQKLAYKQGATLQGIGGLQINSICIVA
jgi:hypothetical protein